jgi:2-methylisocitrate lyase-like PEP mutase family enzyme
MEVHSGLSALIVSKAKAACSSKGVAVGFDAMWSSSLTSSSVKAKPDIEAVDTSARLQIVNDCLEVSPLPLIYDGDTGGPAEVFRFSFRSFLFIINCL